jgi:hypothetical protein
MAHELLLVELDLLKVDLVGLSERIGEPVYPMSFPHLEPIPKGPWAPFVERVMLCHTFPLYKFSCSVDDDGTIGFFVAFTEDVIFMPDGDDYVTTFGNRESFDPKAPQRSSLWRMLRYARFAARHGTRVRTEWNGDPSTGHRHSIIGPGSYFGIDVPAVPNGIEFQEGLHDMQLPGVDLPEDFREEASLFGGQRITGQIMDAFEANDFRLP